MKKRSQSPMAIRIMRQLIERIPEKSNGTYNNGDPTAWSKGSKIFELKQGTFFIKYNDCTWGVELTIYKAHCPLEFLDLKPTPVELLERGYHRVIGSFYLSFEGYKEYTLIYKQRNRGLLKLITLINRQFNPIPEPEYIDDPMGCLSDYE